MRPDLFICPVCSGSLTAVGGALKCPVGHSFDIARQGYVSLVTGAKARGDTAQMVRARASFLASGIYEPIAQGLLDAARSGLSCMKTMFMADLGGGTGWYSAYLLDRFPTCDGVLIDASAHAARTAAKAHPRLTVATADLWAQIPLSDGIVDIALVVFAPRNPAEIARVLSSSGVCLVVTPTSDHLRELRDRLPMLGIDPEKQLRLEEQFAGFASHTTRVEYTRQFSPSAVAQVLGMGPNAFHLAPDQIEAACQIAPLDVTVSVLIHAFRRR